MSNLIAKKDLLLRYHISYGALYRWKRMGLIPEEWFIRRSTVTGQETFFDEEQICQRIEMILSSKDDSSLTEMAKQMKSDSDTTPRLLLVLSHEKKVFPLSAIEKLSLLADGNETDILQHIRSLYHE